ncbi:MAG: hypothetical protein HY903_22445 [Deltaproteobacteria bacterium]|nr:hypothetical protein [Deltaproteobacteria bacterium]
METTRQGQEQGTPGNRAAAPQGPTTEYGQWRPGRLLIAMVVMVGVIVAAWIVAR